MSSRYVATRLAGLVAMTALACDEVSAVRTAVLGAGPDETVLEFLAAKTEGDWPKAYRLVSASDQRARTLQVFSEQEERLHAFVIASHTSFDVVAVEAQTDRAEVVVDIAVPDLGGVLAGVFAAALGGKHTEEMQRQLAAKFEGGDVPMRTLRETYTAVREVDGWRVFLDWEWNDKIAKAMEEGRALRKTGEPAKALEAFEAALALDASLDDAIAARDELRAEIAEAAEKAAYIEQLAVYDVSAKYFKTYSGEVPGVVFKLRNEGDRALDKVEVTFFFEGPDGAVIAEEDYHPVLVSDFSFSGNNKPLKPNYVWQMERGKFYRAANVPSEWKEGAVSAKVTDIQFSES